jgi:hypothetical protein
MTYDNGDDIFMKPYGGDWSLPVHVVPASIVPISHASQVSADTRDPDQHHVHVVWQARDSDSDQPFSVMYQGYESKTSEFTAASEFVSGSGQDFFAPTITQLASGKLFLSWHNGSWTYRASKEPDADWTIDDRAYPYIHPNFAADGTYGPLYVTRAVHTAVSGSPYALQISGELTDGPHENDVTMVYSRKGIVAEGHKQGQDTSASFSLTLSPIRLRMIDGSTRTVEFIPVNYRMPGTSESTLWSQLATASITLTGSVDSVFVQGTVRARALNRIRAQGWNAHRLAFEVVDAGTSEVLARIGAERLFSTSGKYAVTERGSVANLANRTVFVRPAIRGMIQGRRDLTHTLVHLYTLTDSSANPSAPNAAKGKAQPSRQLPTVFAVYESYPNPFNPSTTIKYDLPEQSHVSLVIYDVLGRKVVELENGVKDAGYHNVQWSTDNGQLSSGVYFARFVATDASGSVKLSKVNKLLLTK